MPDEPYRLTLKFDHLPPMNTPATRRHWAAQAREARLWKLMVVAAVGRRRPRQPLDRAHIRLTRHSAVEPDLENNAYAMKPLVDGLVRAGVLKDDGPGYATREYLWERAPRGRGFLTIEVEEIAA